MHGDRHDLVLLVLDTARFDVFDELIESGELPHIQSLVEEGQYYAAAKANGPWTVPSHGSIFTGEYPSEHGVTGKNPEYDSVPLVERLNNNGYATAAFSANPWLSPVFGFDEPFDAFLSKYDFSSEGLNIINTMKASGFLNRLRTVQQGVSNTSVIASLYNMMFFWYQHYSRQDSGGKHLLSRAASWIQSADSPSFAFINVTEPHLPHSIPESALPEGVTRRDLSRVNQDPGEHNTGNVEMSESDFALLNKTYRATFRYLDQFIGQFVRSASDDATVIIAGDHGEHFGEHGRFGHQYSLYEELLHVPLLISGSHTEREIVSDPVELRHLFNYISETASGQPPAVVPTSEVTVAEYVNPISETMRERARNGLPEYVSRYGDGARSITSDGCKFLEFADGTDRLLRLTDDGETELSDDETKEQLRQRLYDDLGSLDAADSVNYSVPGSVRGRLNDLGYI